MAAQLLTDVLLARADAKPDTVAYECVDPSGEVSALSYAQLAARASTLAAQLVEGATQRASGHVGDGPVLLAYPAGLDYPVAVFAAFLAGRPVIPAYPPGPAATPDRDRLAGITADARPPVVIAARDVPDLGAPVVLAVPGPEADDIPWRRPPGASPLDVAIVQYTSGSTGRPRGVLVRHSSVAANTAAIAERFSLDGDSRGLIWLPPFHDMGLIGGLLTPVVAGIPVRIMPPADFLKSPLWWLRQITESGATASGGPNFAYDLCVRRTRGRPEEALAGLDLSRWRVAFNGGEPVRHRTLIEFAATFAPVGFRAEAFLPCYGLAEAALIVSAGHWRPAAEPVAAPARAAEPQAISGAPAGAGTPVASAEPPVVSGLPVVSGAPAGSGPPARSGAPVSCGTPVAGQRVAVVDPERLVPVVDGNEGEIWVAGAHITPGYLSGRDQEDLFGDLDGVRYLRTGDLGYLRGGELFLTGRAKDVIIFRGVNYHAVDVEAVALEAAGRSAGTVAAFSVDLDAEPFPALVLEVRGATDPSLAGEVRAAVLARTGLRLGVVVLAPPRSVPRTSSGKVRRAACREALLAGAYGSAGTSGAKDGTSGARDGGGARGGTSGARDGGGGNAKDGPGGGTNGGRAGANGGVEIHSGLGGVVVGDKALLAALAGRHAADTVAGELAAVICGVVAAVCEATGCQPTDNLVDLGVDSVHAAEAAAVLEDALGLTVPLEAVLTAATPRAVADALVSRWLAEGSTPDRVRERVAAADNRAGVF